MVVSGLGPGRHCFQKEEVPSKKTSPLHQGPTNHAVKIFSIHKSPKDAKIKCRDYVFQGR